MAPNDIDLIKASEIAKDWARKNIGSMGGNLTLLQFRIESITENGDKTKFFVVFSIQPDIGQERVIYIMKVNIATGKPEQVGIGKKDKDGNIVMQNLPEDWKK